MKYAAFRFTVIVVLFLSVVIAAPSSAEAPLLHKQAPGFFRWNLGSFEITALNDGTSLVPIDKLLHGANTGEIQEAYARDFLPLPVATSRNEFMINTGSKLILVDAGGGDDFDAHEGRLRESLVAAGFRPEQVDIVLFTHLHSDHIGGLLADGKRAFPNAVIRLDRREAEYWLTPANEEAAPATEKAGFRTARTDLAPYLAAGRVSTFDGATEIVPGIRSLPAYGHTPGHSFYSIESGGQMLVLWGDVIHSAPVQFPDTNVTIAFDWNETLARSVREQAFADAANRAYWVAGAHLPFPGTGHIRSQGRGYTFIPANWALNH
jgi:glyoxylase-like metal-dependent hydrolase (beta-lactamase superfamily II)